MMKRGATLGREKEGRGKRHRRESADKEACRCRVENTDRVSGCMGKCRMVGQVGQGTQGGGWCK